MSKTAAEMAELQAKATSGWMTEGEWDEVKKYGDEKFSYVVALPPPKTPECSRIVAQCVNDEVAEFIADCREFDFAAVAEEVENLRQIRNPPEGCEEGYVFANYELNQNEELRQELAALKESTITKDTVLDALVGMSVSPDSTYWFGQLAARLGLKEQFEERVNAKS